VSTTSDDLTARARIRDAALRQFAEHGFAKTTIRGIAAEAGVSPGLVRHHFGSKEALRDAVDAYVVAEIRRLNDVAASDVERGAFSPALVNRETLRPFQGYLAHALFDGSATIARMYDELVRMMHVWVERTQPDDGTYASDPETRAAVFIAMVLGIPLLREHLSRALGVDSYSAEGDHRVALALLDIYSHAVIDAPTAQAARDALEAAKAQGRPQQ
jgi:TetR/AcrR family transcriptional regulator, regulator of cefoperazone and chloramphenicol sensitivity